MNGLKLLWRWLSGSQPISTPLVLLMLLAAVGAWTSYYTIAAESEGVVLRFGKYILKVPPGLEFVFDKLGQACPGLGFDLGQESMDMVMAGYSKEPAVRSTPSK
jgi:hypothetical protein